MWGDTMHPDPVRNVAEGRCFLKPLPHVSAQKELVAMKQINSLHQSELKTSFYTRNVGPFQFNGACSLFHEMISIGVE